MARLTFRRALMLGMLCSLLALATGGCSTTPERETITIGYMGGLSGRSASLGIAGRDGARLAVERANADATSGPIFALEAADDATDSVTAVRRLSKDAVAIVGPMTSASAIAAVPAANELGISLVSPTVSTDQLSGIDDYFMRLYPSNESAARALARTTVAEFGDARVSVIYDLGNRAHTLTWLGHFKRALLAEGGQVVSEKGFVSGASPDYTRLASKAVDDDASCVFILANAIDTAMLCQRIRAAGSDVPILASEWSATDDLIQNGGRAVEGTLFLGTFNGASQEPNYRRFVRDFRRRFGYEPGFAAIHAFDATSLVIDAASHGATRETIKSALTGGTPVKGLQAAVRIDRYGDVEPEYHLMTVRDGRFVRVDQK